jgi:ribosomal protein S18 acetylase RimI-like enzyme
MATLREIVIDCSCAPALARFWAGVLQDYSVRAYDDVEIARLAALGLTPETDPTVLIDGPGPSLCFQEVAHGQEPGGRLHLDVSARDRSLEVARLVALGASVRRVSDRYTVLDDPEGNRFCVADARAPQPARLPGTAAPAQPLGMRPPIEVRVEPTEKLADLGRISSAFQVERVYDVSPVSGGLGGLVLEERPVAVPWTKDYDALPLSHPASWTHHFDVSRWGLLTAWCGGMLAGGAVIAGSAEVGLLEARPGDAVLWDLRVDLERRRVGIGSALLNRAERWAASSGRDGLMVETQNVNVPACRLYAHHGFTLVAIQRHAYPTLPDEVRLIWRKRLESS